MIALLAFILGIWLWDHYFGKAEGYAPGTEEMALVKIDRDLRLADAMSHDPLWLKWMVGVENPGAIREEALESLRLLSKEKQIGLPGLEALAVIQAEQEGSSLVDSVTQITQGRVSSDFSEASENLASHRGTWWEAKLVEATEKNMRPASLWRETFGHDTQRLRSRAIAVRSTVWLIILVGFAFVPRTLIVLFRGLRNKPRGYAGAWPLPLGLVVFLVATLAWIGFTMILEIGVESLPNLHPLAGLLLDSAARLLPALIALGLLFRRPRHAIHSLGLDKPVATKPLLGLFSLLMILDQLLQFTLQGGPPDPAGGLSAGEAGLWGLVFAMVSACLLAPFSEELLYRGILFRSMWNRLGVTTAAILSATVFAVLHFYDGYGLASVGMFGFTCALLYAATGSLTTTIALHMLYNTSIKLPEWLIYHAPLG